MVHFLRVALWDPVAHAWQNVGLQPAGHEAPADGPDQPRLEVGVLLPPQQQGGRGQLLGLQGEVPMTETRQTEGWLPPPPSPPTPLSFCLGPDLPEDVSVVIEGPSEATGL